MEESRTLLIPKPWMEQIQKEFQKLPLLSNSGKIILTFEISCGVGGTVNDIEFKQFVQRKWKH